MRIIPVLVFVLISSFVYSQNISLGIVTGDNLSFTTVKADKELTTDVSYSSLPGFSIGLVAAKELAPKWRASAALCYERRRDLDKTKVMFTDEMGNRVGEFPDRRIINNYVKTELNLGYKLEENFTIGTGVNIRTLFNSKTKINEITVRHKYENYHYRTINFSIPVFASYSFYRFNATLVFDKGILSRMKDSASNVKEIENTLTVQLTYFFLRER